MQSYLFACPQELLCTLKRLYFDFEVLVPITGDYRGSGMIDQNQVMPLWHEFPSQNSYRTGYDRSGKFRKKLATCMLLQRLCTVTAIFVI